MSEYKFMCGVISRLSDCGYNQLTNRAILMALNGYDNKVSKLEQENERLKKEVAFLEKCNAQDKYLCKQRVGDVLGINRKGKE